MKTDPETEKLLKERNGKYKDAWRETGLMLRPAIDGVYKLLMSSPSLFYPWIAIFNKLVRLLGDPRHKDSWRDIIGYATLALDELDVTDIKQ